MSTPVATTNESGRLWELVRYFLRLGLLGFGGPVALVGQMERELVAERSWLTKEQRDVTHPTISRKSPNRRAAFRFGWPDARRSLLHRAEARQRRFW